MKPISLLAIAATTLALSAPSVLAAPDGIAVNDGVLTGANGMTLYIFDKDEPGVTNCYEQCAINWPPLIANEGDMAEGDYTLVERTDGGMQWAYKGMPLYLWIKDANPGDKTGDGVGGVWHLAEE